MIVAIGIRITKLHERKSSHCNLPAAEHLLVYVRRLVEWSSSRCDSHLCLFSHWIQIYIHSQFQIWLSPLASIICLDHLAVIVVFLSYVTSKIFKLMQIWKRNGDWSQFVARRGVAFVVKDSSESAACIPSNCCQEKIRIGMYKISN